MSADDCVAILETSVYPSWGVREYRVEHCQAIDNIHISPHYTFYSFNKSPVFDTLQDAIMYAKQVESRVGPTEYGILKISKYKRLMWEEIFKLSQKKVK
jgi:hypothetical protein